MRFLFLIPDLLPQDWRRQAMRFVQMRSRLTGSSVFRQLFVHPSLHAPVAFGGTLNIMRHCAIARDAGVDAALSTPSGKNSYGRFGVVDVPYVRWADRRPDDVCIVPDFCTELISSVEGPAIAYLQVPNQLRANFDYWDPRVELWTDSPFMLERCREVFIDKEARIVPNVVDDKTFAFRPQSEREPGLLFCFPRKGPEFIEATQREYKALGGTYWRFELVDGLSLRELATAMQRPQAFLASAEVEGCALPPQESMAAGIIVVGRSAKGANFSMEHRRTAMVAETPRDAALSLKELEDATLRDQISRNALEFISRYFPGGEPRAFWESVMRERLGTQRAAS